MSEQVLTELNSGVLKITINRPQKKNALNSAMYNAMTTAIAGADGDDAVRVILLIGLAENIGIWKLPSEWKGVLVFVILMIVIIFMPQGLLSARGKSKD